MSPTKRRRPTVPDCGDPFFVDLVEIEPRLVGALDQATDFDVTIDVGDQLVVITDFEQYLGLPRAEPFRRSSDQAFEKIPLPIGQIGK